MGLRDWLFMMKLKTQADDYKYKMKLSGISGSECYLNLDIQTGEVTVYDGLNTELFRTAFTLREIAEHKILRMYVQVCELERVLEDANSWVYTSN